MQKETLHKSILRTLLYYDIFSHPLTEEEVYFFLQENTVSKKEIMEVIQTLTRLDEIEFGLKEGYVFIKPAEKNIAVRKDKEIYSRKMWRFARIATQIIKRCPFVRCVMVTGSLSKNSSYKDSDLDFMVITERNRLWIARTLLMLFKKIFLFNSYKFFCINFFITEDHLEIEDKNIFTATEIIHIKTTYNEPLMMKFLKANSWVTDFFPNYHCNESVFHYTGFKVNNRNSFVQYILEMFFPAKMANKLDEILRNKTRSYLYKRYNNIPDSDKNQMFKSTPSVSKTHPGNMQEVILRQYYEKLKQFNI